MYGDEVYYLLHFAEWNAKPREEKEDAIQRVRFFPTFSIFHLSGSVFCLPGTDAVSPFVHRGSRRRPSIESPSTTTEAGGWTTCMEMQWLCVVLLVLPSACTRGRENRTRGVEREEGARRGRADGVVKQGLKTEAKASKRRMNRCDSLSIP
jgi:hypothetical protein